MFSSANNYSAKNPDSEPSSVSWTPQEGPQMAFHQAFDYVDELLYGGAAGGGKSESLLIESIRQADFKNYRAIVFRRTFPELQTSLIPRAYDLLYGVAKPRYKGTEWTFPSGAVLHLAHLQHEDDKERHKSSEYDFIGFDELTSFSESQYIYLFSRCRGKNPDVKRRIRSATNPTGSGHGWVKKRFVEPDLDLIKHVQNLNYKSAYGWKVNECIHTNFENLPDNYQKGEPVFDEEKAPIYLDKQTKLKRCFLPALIWGNAHLIKADPNYVNRVLSMSPKQRKALLYGSWDVFEGQFFSSWDPNVHVVEPFEIPRSWRRFVGIDYGFTAPMAALWGAMDEEGCIYIYRELYGSKLTTEDQARDINTLTEDEQIEMYAADPSMWQTSGHGIGERHADIYDRNGVSLTPSSNKRVPGWALVHEYLGTNRLFFFSTCKNTIRTLPTLVHSRNNPEDLDTLQEDHCLISGTLISTPEGYISIENLQPGDLVYTEHGVAPVLFVHKNGLKNVYEMECSDGHSLTGTSNHLLKNGKHWMPLGTLYYTDFVWQLKQSSSKVSPFVGIRILRDVVIGCIFALVEMILSGELKRFMLKSIKSVLEKFRQIIIFITKMGIRLIMFHRILLPLMSRAIYRNTVNRDGGILNIEKKCLNILKKIEIKQRNGMDRKKDGCGTANTRKRFIRNGSGWIISVLSAVKKLVFLSKCFIGRSFAEGHVKQELCVLGVKKKKKKEIVYNLTVAGDHTYFANNILVHNCVDALRYMILTLRGEKTFIRQQDNVRIPSWWHNVKEKQHGQKVFKRVTL